MNFAPSFLLRKAIKFLKSPGIANTFKSTSMVLIFPISILYYYLFETNQDYYEYIFSFVVIFLGTAYILYPYSLDYAELAKYMNQLSLNRVVKSPKFKSSTAVIELSESLKTLRRSWELRQVELNNKIAESNLLFNTIPDILIMLNQNMVIVRANEAAHIAFGSNLTGKNMEDVLNNKTLLGSIRWVIHDKIGKQVEISIPTPSAKEYLAKVEHYDKQSHDQYSVLVMLHDITERKRAEQTFADFVANASHEIRTPLTSIIGITETLQSSKHDTDALDTFLPMIETQSERMKILINELLNLSSIEKSVKTPPTDTIDILDVLEITEQQLEWNLNECKNKVVKKIGKNIPTITGDFQQINQIFHNLLSNAIKYGKHGTNITIKVEATKDFPKSYFQGLDVHKALAISFSDKGFGIEPEYIDRLTERFFRVDKSRSRKIGGTGLGLAIVKQALVRHNAYLKIESTLNKGSTFTVFFPVQEH